MRQMMKRRLEDAGLPDLFSPHSFRVTVVTDLFNQNVPLEDVRYLAGHASPTTTPVYDRRRAQGHPQYRRADFCLGGRSRCDRSRASQVNLMQRRDDRHRKVKIGA
jgi:Phage integrase family